MFVFINPDILKPVICINKKQSNVHKWIDATPQNEGGGGASIVSTFDRFCLKKNPQENLYSYSTVMKSLIS